MPDQSSAATEHSIIQEITAPLATLPDDPVSIAADVDFPIVLRGYDRVAVNAYIKKTSQLVAELQATRSPEAAIRRALERVGEEISGVLQRAHETAGEVTAQSRREAEERLERTRQEATQITAAAHARVKDLDADTDRIWAERHRIVSDARDLARQLIELADAAAERFPPAEEPEVPATSAQQESEAAPTPPEEPEARATSEPAPLGAEADPERLSGGPPTSANPAATADSAGAGRASERQEFPDPVDERAQTLIMPPVRPPDDSSAGG